MLATLPPLWKQLPGRAALSVFPLLVIARGLAIQVLTGLVKPLLLDPRSCAAA